MYVSEKKKKNYGVNAPRVSQLSSFIRTSVPISRPAVCEDQGKSGSTTDHSVYILRQHPTSRVPLTRGTGLTRYSPRFHREKQRKASQPTELAGYPIAQFVASRAILLFPPRFHFFRSLYFSHIPLLFYFSLIPYLYCSFIFRHSPSLLLAPRLLLTRTRTPLPQY